MSFSERAQWCFDRARYLGVKGILMLTGNSLIGVGYPDPKYWIADNDNEAKE